MSQQEPIIASVSGGKDSTALCLFLRQEGIPYVAVHMNTGWEHPKTDRYIKEVLPSHIGPIEWIEPPMTMVPLIYHKAMFPSRTRRYCTQYLKVYPLMQWMSVNYPHEQTINAVGIRAAESAARAKLEEYEDLAWSRTWRPLLRWSEQDVIDIHRKYDCPPNPLYIEENVRRVGCWPCIFASKKEIKRVAETDPARIDLIRKLEHDVSEAARLRYEARGETFESLGYCDPTFFALKEYVPDKETGEIVRKNVNTPIDEVVKWSMTSHGGKQFELFGEDEREGCMRWGLCDVGGE